MKHTITQKQFEQFNAMRKALLRIAVKNEEFIEIKLKEFEANPNYTPENLKALAVKYSGLKVTDINNKAELKAVHEARMDLVDTLP